MTVSIFNTAVYSLDIESDRLFNNKETKSSLIDLEKAQDLVRTYQPFAQDELRSIFYVAVEDQLEEFKDWRSIHSTLCDSTILMSFEKALKRQQYAYTKENVAEYIDLLRANQSIDDLLYDILLELQEERNIMAKIIGQAKMPMRLSRYTEDKLFIDTDLATIYQGFSQDTEFPCLYRRLNHLVGNIVHSLPSGTRLNSKIFKKFNFEALNQDIISVESFRQLEYLRRKSRYLDRSFPLAKYYEITFRAKNSMVPLSTKNDVTDLSLENDYTSKQIKRFEKMTRREALYAKYDSTQIVMLAQILESASRRMGTDPDVESSIPFVEQTFSILQADGTRENYVEKFELDTQSQYNLARRRMRMDIIDLQNSDTFAGKGIEYSEIIVAALETGYISHEDIEYVVKYDDLWNREMPKWYRLKNFFYTLGRATIFYLPPPMNITGSLAFVAIESFLADRKNIGERNDNPATFIE